MTSNSRQALRKGWNRIRDGFSGDLGPQDDQDPYHESSRTRDPYSDTSQLKALCDGQSLKIQDLTSRLQIEEEKTKRLSESTDKMIIAMENKDLFLGRQHSDEEISGRFRWLMNQIKTWSMPFADRDARAPLSGGPDISKEDLARIAPIAIDIPSFFKNPTNVRAFVRAWVGVIMAEIFFPAIATGMDIQTHGVDLWMDRELATAVHQIESRLSNSGEQSIPILSRADLTLATDKPPDRTVLSLRDLHDWKALTNSLVARLSGSSKTGIGQEEVVKRCNDRILEVVGPLAPEEERTRISVDLLNILFQAIDLSKTLRCQRAYWTLKQPERQVREPDAPVFYDAVVMDDLHGDEDSDAECGSRQYKKIVEIVVTPALFKRGNADGERFDIETCICRGEVRTHSPTVPAKGHHQRRRDRQ